MQKSEKFVVAGAVTLVILPVLMVSSVYLGVYDNEAAVLMHALVVGLLMYIISSVSLCVSVFVLYQWFKSKQMPKAITLIAMCVIVGLMCVVKFVV